MLRNTGLPLSILAMVFTTNGYPHSRYPLRLGLPSDVPLVPEAQGNGGIGMGYGQKLKLKYVPIARTTIAPPANRQGRVVERKSLSIKKADKIAGPMRNGTMYRTSRSVPIEVQVSPSPPIDEIMTGSRFRYS